jgi:O-antigen ligase
VHNTYLGVWAETGLFGIAALVVFYLGVLRSAWQVFVRGDREMAALGFALSVAVAVLYIYGVTNFGLRMRHLWCVFGVVLAAWNVVAAAPARPAATEQAA